MTFRIYADSALTQQAEYTHFTEPAAQYWQASTPVVVGDWVYAGDHWYEVTVGGTTGAAPPTWPIDGSTVSDNTVTWLDKGAANATLGKRPVDRVLYFGSSDAADVGKKVQDKTAPGVNQLSVTIIDSAPGSGHEDDEVTLSLTEAGLDTATPGDPLDIGLQVLAGVGGAVPFWVRLYDSTGVQGTSLELSLYVGQYIYVDQ